MLMRFDPFRDFDRIASQLLGDVRTPRMMPMDAYRSNDTFYVHFDLPGVDPDSIDLTVEQNVLTVTAKRSFDRADAEEYVVSERPQGQFSRQVFLGDGLDTERLEATYTDGVLTVTVPVLEAAKPRRIQIAVGDSGRQAITAGASSDAA